MPPTSIFIRAASSGTSGIGYSRISVLLGPVRTAASTFSATEKRYIIIVYNAEGNLAHVPEKWEPVFRLGHAPTQRISAQSRSRAVTRFHAAALPQGTSRAPRCRRAAEGLDARAFQAARRRGDPGVGGGLRPAGLSADRDRRGVLDRERQAPSLQAVQAGHRGRGRRSSSRLAQACAGRDRRVRSRLLLKPATRMPILDSELSSI